MLILKRRVRFRHLVILLIAFLTLAPMSAVGYRISGARSDHGEDSKRAEVRIVKTAGGITLALESIAVDSTETTLEFALSLPEIAVPVRTPQLLGPIFIEKQLVLDNIEAKSAGLHVRVKPHSPGETVQHFALILGKVVDQASPVSVTFTELPVYTDDGIVVLEGPWQFEIPQTVFGADGPSSINSPDIVTRDGGIEVTVSRLESYDSSLDIHFTIHSQLPEAVVPVGRGIQLELSDGSVIDPRRVERVDGNDPTVSNAETVNFIASFASSSLQEHVRAIVVFGPYLTTNATPATIVIRNPHDAWSADAISVNGETIAVGEVNYNGAEDATTIVIENREPIDEANVLFLGLGATPTLQDGTGNEYEVVSASTGMRREGSAIGAGTTTVSIRGPINPGVEEIILSVEYSGILKRTSLAADITLP